MGSINGEVKSKGSIMSWGDEVEKIFDFIVLLLLPSENQVATFCHR